MLLAAGSLRDGSLTVGDFVLFVSYLAFIADYIADGSASTWRTTGRPGRLRAHGRRCSAMPRRTR